MEMPYVWVEYNNNILVSEDAAADWLFNYRTTTATAKGVEGFPNGSWAGLYDLVGAPGTTDYFPGVVTVNAVDSVPRSWRSIGIRR